MDLCFGGEGRIVHGYYYTSNKTGPLLSAQGRVRWLQWVVYSVADICYVSFYIYTVVVAHRPEYPVCPRGGVL